MRTSIATVSISGALTEKLHASAAAGFDGVEIFEPDLIASDHSPEEIRSLARRLGLSLDLYQPLRDIEGVDEDTFAENLRRAGATFATAQRLGIDTILVCSNVATATIDSDEVSADQLRRLGDLAAAVRHPGGLRGAGVGPVHRRLPPVVARRRARRPSVGRAVPRQLSRAVPWPRPRRHQNHPRRQDLLPPACRRPRAQHGRAVLEPSPSAVPRRRHVRPGHLRLACAVNRFRRPALARGLQRHVPADRPGPHRGACAAFAGMAAGQGRRATCR